MNEAFRTFVHTLPAFFPHFMGRSNKLTAVYTLSQDRIDALAGDLCAGRWRSCCCL